jgi:uncharacterized protein (DUF1330 family)
MAKGYWIGAYRTIFDLEKLNAYARLAGPAIEASGGRLLSGSTPGDWRRR